MANGSQLIADERARQVMEEDWTPEHDDDHHKGELSAAAIVYAKAAYKQVAFGTLPDMFASEEGRDWPWDSTWWKPSQDPVCNLIKAGALIAAEIDRLQRARP